MSSISYGQLSDTYTEKIQRNKFRTNLTLIFFFALIIGYQLWRDSNLSIVKAVEVDNINLISPIYLCPGEPLIFSYELHAKGPGLLIRDMTVWRVDPPRTIIYSLERRFILGDAVDQRLREAWVIPKTYQNFETGESETIPPGHYRRYMAISSPSKESVIDIKSVDFYIRENCNES